MAVLVEGNTAYGSALRMMLEGNRLCTEGCAILPFPLQNALTRPLRTAAAKHGRAEFLSLWAGQGVRMARRMTAAELVKALVAETDTAIRRIQNDQNDQNDSNVSNVPNVPNE